MEFLKRYFGIEQLQQERTLQLQRQAEQDQHLKKAAQECPYLVSSFLLYERQENRCMTYEYAQHPFSAYFVVAQSQLNRIHKRQDEFDAAVRSDTLCNYLFRTTTPSP